MTKDLIILSGGGELTSGGEGAAIMELTLTRTVNADQELTLGSVCSAMLEFTFINPDRVTITPGQEATLFRVAENGSRQQVGIFLLEKPVQLGQGRCRVTGYDRVSLLDKDLTDWVSTLGSITLESLARQVCEGCGLTLAQGEIPNGSLTVSPISGQGITGRQIMKWIAEAAGCFCTANAQGALELGWYSDSGIALGPEILEGASLQVEDRGLSLSTRSVKTIDDNRGNVSITGPVLDMTSGEAGEATLTAPMQAQILSWLQGSLELGQRPVEEIQGVQLSEFHWPAVAAGANTYVIAQNPFLNRTAVEVETALQTVLTRLKSLGSYPAFRAKVVTEKELLPGSILTLTDTGGKVYRLPVMTAKRKGSLWELECTGSPRRDSSEVSNFKTMSQIAWQQVQAQTQQDVFNKLTDNGKLQGLYIEDGKLYINAEFVKILNLVASSITSGRLSSANGSTYFDLDLGHIICGGGNQFTTISDGSVRIADTGQLAYIHLYDKGILFSENGSFVGQLASDDGLRLSCYDEAVGRPVLRKLGWKTVNGETVLGGIE